MKQLNLLKTLFLLCALMVGSSSVWADTWTRVTSVETLQAGGTFIMGFEATANSGVIVPLRTNSSAATTSANGMLYSGTGTGTTSNNGTIDMSSVTVTTNYELYVSASATTSGAINMQLGSSSGNYIGSSNSKNTAKLYASASDNTAYTPTMGTNNVVTLTCAGADTYNVLSFNNNLNQYRYCNYSGTGQQKVVFYKKEADVRTPIATIGDLTPMAIAKDDMGTFTVGVTAAAAYTVSYESSDDDILLVDASGEYGGVAKGNATITVTVTPDDAVTYKPVSKDFAVEVYDATEKGTKWVPFTVAEAITHIDGGSDLTNKYVKGIIHSVVSYNSTYHSITYWISDDGTTDAFEVYSGKGLNGADFSASSDLRQGDIVVVKGTLKKYGDVYEFDKNNELYSIKYATKYVTDAGYATYVAEFDMEFDEGDAFAVVVDGGVAKLNGVTKVKENTPVLLKGEGYKNVIALDEIPAAITTDLHVSAGGDPGANAYVLANKTAHGVGFYKWNGGSLTSGLVYLQATTPVHEFIGFEDESGDVTGIEATLKSNEAKNNVFFNLAGQRVAQPTKGLYIVNGKKVVIK